MAVHLFGSQKKDISNSPWALHQLQKSNPKRIIEYELDTISLIKTKYWSKKSRFWSNVHFQHSTKSKTLHESWP